MHYPTLCNNRNGAMQFFCQQLYNYIGLPQTIVAILGIFGNIVAGFILSRREMRNAFNLLLVTLACFDSTYVSINVTSGEGDPFYQENTFIFCYCSSLVAFWRAFARSSSWSPTSTSSFSPIFYGPLRKSSSLAPSS